MHQLQWCSWALQTQGSGSIQLEPAPGTDKELQRHQRVASSQESIMVLPAWRHQHLQNQHLWGLLGHFLRDCQDSWCYYHLVFILTFHLLQSLCSVFALLPLAYLKQILLFPCLIVAAQLCIGALSLQFSFPSHWQFFPLFSYLQSPLLLSAFTCCRNRELGLLVLHKPTRNLLLQKTPPTLTSVT